MMLAAVGVTTTTSITFLAIDVRLNGTVIPNLYLGHLRPHSDDLDT
jgi:hypothetical protein